MQSTNYQFLISMQMAAHGLLMAAVLVVCVVGWMRHRHMGFAVLVGWALASLAWVGLQAPLRMLLANFSAANSTTYVLASHLVSSIALTSLLLAGLALLVFKPIGRPADKPAP